jgi:hypothetical protein
LGLGRKLDEDSTRRCDVLGFVDTVDNHLELGETRKETSNSVSNRCRKRGATRGKLP